MTEIGKIDENVAVKEFSDDGVFRFHSPLKEPFGIHGLIPEFPLRRIPRDIALAANEQVEALSLASSGGRIRFITNSNKIAIRASMPDKCTFPHMTFVGTSCFDQYVKFGKEYVFNGLFLTGPDREDVFEDAKFICGEGERDVTVNFPLYDRVSEIYIGLERDAYVKKAPAYTHEKPVVFYGSSITQGGCASRPGNCYQNMILRRFDCDYENYGLAGRAMGELPIAGYIAERDMSAFVYDYDFNAPDVEHLNKTHEPFFLKIREKNPDLPVIMISRINWTDNAAGDEIMNARRRVIETTMENAQKRGDKNVFFINGFEFSRESLRRGVTPSDCTVDGIHPNDLGFSCMAKVIGDKIAEVLGW